MNILLIGSGGREHALAWKIVQSPLCERLWCAPGNAGIAETCEVVALDAANHNEVVAFCRENEIELVVIGPEQPLVEGLADALARAGIKAFGPSAAAAQLEGSKGFTKDLCRRAGIPTAAYERFTDSAAAKAYLLRHALPVVIKADGLAAGKGVIIAETLADAEAAVDALGPEIVVEEFLTGEEASVFALVDGRTALPLASAQDHKRVGDGDTGPNTGGMGAYSPAPIMTPDMERRVMAEIIEPTVATMAADGAPFVGVLYAGLMITAEGPKLIEYNVRFGDPECQVLMVRMHSDIVPAMIAACDGALEHFAVQWKDETALTVVMAAEGYPGTPTKGTVIEGLADAREAIVFHAGTKRRDDGALVASGGRVLAVTALGRTVGEAQARAYAAAEKIRWPGGFYRHDIGWRAVEREKAEA
jgi:phosphoribosylamine--glycine ligase